MRVILPSSLIGTKRTLKMVPGDNRGLRSLLKVGEDCILCLVYHDIPCCVSYTTMLCIVHLRVPLNPAPRLNMELKINALCGSPRLLAHIYIITWYHYARECKDVCVLTLRPKRSLHFWTDSDIPGRLRHQISGWLRHENPRSSRVQCLRRFLRD